MFLYHTTAPDTIRLIILPDIGNGYPPPLDVTSGIVCELNFHVKSSAPVGYAGIRALNFVDTVISGGDTIIYRTYPQMSDSEAVTDYELGVEPGAVLVQLPTDVNDGVTDLPNQFDLAQNYPNPFNPTTTISFAIPRAAHVRLEVFNILGQKVETLLDSHLDAGNHQVEFDASAQPSGVYFYKLTTDEQTARRKMVLLK